MNCPHHYYEEYELSSFDTTVNNLWDKLEEEVGPKRIILPFGPPLDIRNLLHKSLE